MNMKRYFFPIVIFILPTYQTKIPNATNFRYSTTEPGNRADHQNSESPDLGCGTLSLTMSFSTSK